MPDDLLGIHHVTAIASDPQANVDFYAGVLGQRLVKRTVNFDDPGTYHLYYGDEVGHPGTIMTFFPWPGAQRGQRGTGQVTVTSYSIPPDAISYWIERLTEHNIPFEGPVTRFDEEVLTVYDPDDLKLELVGHAGAQEQHVWRGGSIPVAYAIRGFYGVTLTEARHEHTAKLLTEVLGLRLLGEDGNRRRYQIGEGVGSVVDVLHLPGEQAGHVAAGTVHHVAWRVADDVGQQAWREEIAGRGLRVSPVMDRQYFHSIYFREPGGVLFEIATDPPGFTFDEEVTELGTGLKLPPWYESMRSTLERRLPPLAVPSSGEAAP